MLLVFSCRGKEQWTHEDFFEQTFSVIQDKSIKRDSLNWKSLERTVRDSIRQFKTAEDAYRALAYTIELIGDGHSVFLDPQTPNRLTEDSSELFYDTFVPVPAVLTKIVGGDIGYVKLTGYVANDERSKLYSLKIRKALYALDSLSGLSGWILYLRENMGGLHSMMPLGVAPLFQDSLVGILVDNQNKYITEHCTNRYFYFDNLKNDSMEVDLDLKLRNERKPVAVLIGSRTASAGETLATAFKFQSSTKLFGSPTKGKTTGLE
ncbi:MAG: S41 family peptidase [Tunicatimonas sp.]